MVQSTSTKKTSTSSKQSLPAPVFGYPAGAITILFAGLNKTGKKKGGARLLFRDANGVSKVFMPKLGTQADRVIAQFAEETQIPKGGLAATVNWSDGEIEIVVE